MFECPGNSRTLWLSNFHKTKYPIYDSSALKLWCLNLINSRIQLSNFIKGKILKAEVNFCLFRFV